MRGLFGLLLLAGGAYLGSYVYFPAAMDQHVSLVQSSRLLASVERDVVELAAIPDSDPVRTFSPNRELASSPPSQHADAVELRSRPRLARDRTVYYGDGPLPARVTTLVERAPIEEVQATDPNKSASILSPWTAVVTTAPSPTGNTRLTSSTPADGAARYALIRDIQTELKRVGCYYGKIDGDWGPGSKRAMTNFIARVNASLPTRNPDFILLSLVQSQPTTVCGTSCGPGQMRIANGQCRSKAIIAQRKAKPKVPTHTASIATPPRPMLVSGWRKVAAAHPDQTQGGFSSPPVPRPVYRKPLPGRMTVGGPQPTRLSAYETDLGVTTYPPATQYSDDTINSSVEQPAETVKRRKLPRTKKRARASSKKKIRRRTSRSRKRSYRKRRNPLRNLLRQGVY